MQLLIFISSVIFITESLPSIRADQEMLDTFHVSCASAPSHARMAQCSVAAVQVVEWICILHFTADYGMRIATCTRRPSADKKLWTYVKQVRHVARSRQLCKAWALTPRMSVHSR